MKTALHTIRTSRVARRIEQDDAHAHAVVELARVVHDILPLLRSRIRGAAARNMISAATSALSAAHAEARHELHPDRTQADLHIAAMRCRINGHTGARVEDDAARRVY